MTLTISPWRVTAVLLASAVGLAVAGVAGQFSKYVLGYNRVFGLVRLFDLDAEGNVPTWYSALLLFLAAALLGVIAYAKRARWEPMPGTGPPSR